MRVRVEAAHDLARFYPVWHCLTAAGGASPRREDRRPAAVKQSHTSCGLLSRLAAALLVAACWLSPAAGQNFRRAGAEFNALRVVSVPPGKNFAVIVTQFFHHGEIREDGRNVAVLPKNLAKPVPTRVLQVGPGDYCRVAFQVVEGQHLYDVLYGGEPLKDEVLPPWTATQGLLLETREYKNCNLNSYSAVRAAYESADVMPLGSAALAGTTFPIDRRAVAAELGFADVTPNSLDAVSDRDFLLDLTYACTVAMVHLSRLCEELVLWSTEEFGFVTMDDSFSTGSSIMPQKKNPDFAELTRGKSGRAVGDLVSLLVMLKGLPLAYNKDMQEDKEPAFDAADTLGDCLAAVDGMLSTMRVNADRMRQGAGGGFMAATDLADHLAARGVPFRAAHEIVGRLGREVQF